MKIDKNTIEMLSSMTDDNLWRVICALGSASGIDLSKTKVSHDDLCRLREAMGQMTEADVGKAAELINSFKQNDRSSAKGDQGRG